MIPVQRVQGNQPAREPESPPPLEFSDFSWLPGNYTNPIKPLSFGPFTGELRVDTTLHLSFQNPQDNTISGSSEAFRHGELQLTHIGIGGDFLHENVYARIMIQLGLYSQTTPSGDASAARGQWQLLDAYRYMSEAYAGYRFPVLLGLHLQAGIFMSYIGLWSYYNFDNWTYQPSFLPSNTPWFLNGIRAQIFVNPHLKIEPWLVNGWQSYARINHSPGLGLQIMWRPTRTISFTANHYIGADTLNNKARKRFHLDYSAVFKYRDTPQSPLLSKAATSLTIDMGCEWDGGVQCVEQNFLGFMLYHRVWLYHNLFAHTLGGGMISNTGRYLVLIPPINGATAFSGTPYFTTNPLDKFIAWDIQSTWDWLPNPFVILRLEFTSRHTNVPYFSGSKGITPPGGNQGQPGSVVENWSPDLVKSEHRLTAAFMVKM
jgi:hypothetical protein